MNLNRNQVKFVIIGEIILVAIAIAFAVHFAFNVAHGCF